MNEFLGWAHTLATTFRFARPWWLLLLAVLPWFWWIARPAKPALPFGGGALSAGPGTSLGRARSSTRNPGSTLGRLAMRSVIVVTTVLGIAGLTVAAPVVGVATVFLIDTSASIPADVQAGAMGFATAALDARGPDDLGGIVTFARGAHIDTPLGHRDPNRPDTRVAQVGVPETVSAPAVNTATNLEDAISTGAALLPPPTAGYLRRLVLLSDGNETTGSARSASRAPALVNVEIATYSVPGRLDDAAIASFVVAPTLHDGDDAEGRISIISPSPITASLKVWARAVGDPAGSTGVGDRGTLVFDRTLDLDQGPAEIPVALGRLSPGAWAFAAELSAPADALPDNNMAWAHTLVSNPARILVVEGSPDTATALRRALGEARILTDVVTPDGIPGTAQGFANFDAILLVDVPTTAMTDAQMTAIREAVSSGGRGLVVAGGEHTFGQGEYAGTPLEEALPVTVQLPEKDQASTLAIVIVIDRSGSMSGIDTRDRRASRMDLAKEGATLAIETLREGDQIGVVAFDYNARWVSEIRPLRGPADFKTVADRIATIQPDGGTDIYAALDVAYRGLQTTQARVKHVILLTDGEGTPAPFPNLLNAYRRANITLSTVGVSSEAGKSLLQDLARRGSGRYYFTDTPSAVPQIMTQEARLAGRAHKQERDFKPRLAAASSAVRGLVPNDFPQLHGYMRTTPRPGAEIILTSDQEETVLAQWQYGLGRALVWTADLEGPWSRDWSDTAAFRSLWVQAIRWSMPAPGNPNIAVRVMPSSDGDGTRARVLVDAWAPGGGFRDLLASSADIAGPDGASRRVNLSQVAPGHYQGDFDARSPGVYFVRVTQTDTSGQVVASEIAGFDRAYPVEFAPAWGNRTLLERLASESGAPTIPTPADAWRRDTIHRTAPRDIWPELLMTSVLLFVVDVALRRLRPTWADVRGVMATAKRIGRMPVTATAHAWEWFVAWPGQGNER